MGDDLPEHLVAQVGPGDPVVRGLPGNTSQTRISHEAPSSCSRPPTRTLCQLSSSRVPSRDAETLVGTSIPGRQSIRPISEGLHLSSASSLAPTLVAFLSLPPPGAPRQENPQPAYLLALQALSLHLGNKPDIRKLVASSQ